jgi:iron(III) transport system permease protein
MLIFIFVLVWIERTARRRQSFVLPSQRPRQPDRIRLNGWQRVLAVVVCALPILIGFVVPALVLMGFAMSRLDQALSVTYLKAVYHSLLLAAVAAAVAVALGLVLGYANRAVRSRFTGNVIRLASMGYAIPGTVLGIGVLIPLAAFDNALDGFLRESFGISTGLLLSGSITAVIFAYVVRFLAISFGTIETGLQKVTPNVAAAARTLGRGPIGAFFEVHLVAAGLLVFVDCMKELPATLILRPFDFETLATSVFMLASMGELEESALPALTIVAAGLLPVILLSRTFHEPHITS